MTDKNNQAPLPVHTDTLREMAGDMGVALYRRYDEKEAAEILGVTAKQLTGLREDGQIGYLSVADGQIGFFGCQMLTYLLDCVIPPNDEPTQKPEPVKSTTKTDQNPDRELISVDEAVAQLGIGKTKFFELMNTKQINRVRIGRRTLIKHSELQDYIEKQMR